MSNIEDFTESELWIIKTTLEERYGEAIEPMLGDKCIEFYHCKTCGCTTHYESIEKDKDSRIAVNTRMMRREDVSDIALRTFDGADTWEFLD